MEVGLYTVKRLVYISLRHQSVTLNWPIVGIIKQTVDFILYRYILIHEYTQGEDHETLNFNSGFNHYFSAALCC